MPATLILLHPLRTGLFPQPVKDGSVYLTVYPRSARSTILSSQMHKNDHHTPEKDMAKPPGKLTNTISEQATQPLPIWSTCPPFCLRRRKVENGKTLVAMRIPFLLLGPLAFGPSDFQLRPINGIFGPPTYPTWPRYNNLISLSSPNFLLSMYYVSMDRRRLSFLVLATKTWSYGYQSYRPIISSPNSTAYRHHHLIHKATVMKIKDPYTDFKLFPEESIHRVSLTAGDILGPLLASCPGKVSRTHDNLSLWMKLSFIEKITRFGSINFPPSLFIVMFCLYGLICRGPLSDIKATSLNRLCEYLLQTPLLISFIATMDENLNFLTSCLVPVRLELMELFSTSQCLLTRTIHHLPELIANVVSTNVGLVCDFKLLCSSLRVPLHLMSNYLSLLSPYHYAICKFVSSLVRVKTLNFVLCSFG